MTSGGDIPDLLSRGYALWNRLWRPSPPPPDLDLEAFMVLVLKAAGPEWLADGSRSEAIATEIRRALGELADKARRDEIIVWGRPNCVFGDSSVPHEPIPCAAWKDLWIDPLEVLSHGDPREVRAKAGSIWGPATFYADLQFNRRQVQDAWRQSRTTSLAGTEDL